MFITMRWREKIYQGFKFIHYATLFHTLLMKNVNMFNIFSTMLRDDLSNKALEKTLEYPCVKWLILESIRVSLQKNNGYRQELQAHAFQLLDKALANTDLACPVGLICCSDGEQLQSVLWCDMLGICDDVGCLKGNMLRTFQKKKATELATSFMIEKL